ncbi:MAG: N-acyl homoserine lactonase family protein [Gammaproteobacteria bacterium]|nr:N-acyl homoserine lactonase family protein [Gammaproteobacteria bacterium]
MTKQSILMRAVFAVTLISILAACAAKLSAPEQPLRLYAFDCGIIEVLDVSLFQPGIGEGERKTLVNTCYLIIHPEGTLLWDTGLPDALVNTPEGTTLYEVFVMRVTKTLAAQLKEINYPPEAIDFLGISHMHGDHVGNADLFPQAMLLMQKEEYDAAFGANPNKFGFNPTAYPTLHSNPVKKLEGDYDVFGDGRVIIKRTLGHTPGHQALYVKLAETGNILLSGDLVHFTDNWVHKRAPSFNFDKERTVTTMNEVEEFLEENQATLWIQHDKEQNAGIKHSPAYYE